MKKLNLIIGILIGITFLSCSSDENNNSTQQDPIIGVWKLTSIELNGENSDLHQCMLEQTNTYKENGNFLSYFWQNEVEPCEFSTVTFQYILEGNILTSINPFETIDNIPFQVTNEIITLNEITLIYKEVADNFEGNYPENQQQVFTYNKVE